MNDGYSNQKNLRTAAPVNAEDLSLAQESLRLSEPILPEMLATPSGFNVASPAEFLLKAVVALITALLLWFVGSFCLSLPSLHFSGVKAMIMESARSTMALRRYARVYRPGSSK